MRAFPSNNVGFLMKYKSRSSRENEKGRGGVGGFEREGIRNNCVREWESELTKETL